MPLSRLIVIIFSVPFFSVYHLQAMENQEKPDFFICNEHDQNVKVSLTFEYKETGPLIAEHSNILILPSHQYPVFIKQIPLINPESKKQAALSEVNLECLIIRVDRPKVPLGTTSESHSFSSLADEDEQLEVIASDIDPNFQPGCAALVFLEKISCLVITETDTDRLEIINWNGEVVAHKI